MPLRRHLLTLLQMKGAHADFDTTVEDFPAELRGQKPDGAPHTAWELLEHLRIAQEDILDFSRNPNYVEKTFPDDYWPKSAEPPTPDAWDKSAAQFKKDLGEMMSLVAKGDLETPFPHGTGQTLLREALLVADHNSYHLGQLMFLRKMLEVRKQ
jgi:hypothetical protein